MSAKTKLICLMGSLSLSFLLFFQSSLAQYDFNKVDTWVNDNLPDLGGRAVLLIYKDGKVVYSKAENNVTERQRKIATFLAKRKGKDADELLQDLTPSSRISIASSSKWLSAALVMTFVDEKKLSLEDTVGKYLPVMTLHGKGNIKIWQCLSHLTGINPGTFKESLQTFKDLNTMNEAMEKIASLPTEGEPGKSFHYSSIGLEIAAAIIEKIGNKPFEEIFEERIAKPCGMVSTDFGHAKVPVAAGGAFSTAGNYLNFLIMILNNGKFDGRQILSASSIDKMQHNYAKEAAIAFTPAEAGNWGYGFGEWTIDDNPGRSLAVSSPGLFGSFPLIDNEKKYAAVLFCFNLKSEGRHEKYTDLKSRIDNAISK